MNKIICKSTGEIAETYLDYLKTTHWARVKHRIKQKHASCQMCGETQALEVHHTTYKDIGNEKDNQLLVLCRSCHQMEHDHGQDYSISKYLIQANKTIKKKKKAKYKKAKRIIVDTWISFNKKNRAK